MGLHMRSITSISQRLLPTLFIAISLASSNTRAQCVGDCGATAQDKTDETTSVQWPREQCDKVKQASGRYLKLSAQAMKKSHNADDLQSKETAFKAGLALNQMAANTASVYDVFCKD